jgi:phospholipid/cholesterol/gamma-HCH transport system substrate-binding protein
MKQNLETKVGLFLMFGIAVVCTLIIFFGAVGDMFKPSYTITLTFPDASGLLKGSEVYLSGAEVGKVTTDPQPVPDSQEVKVNLKIAQSVRIREDAQFTIGSSGLLGDRYVEVTPQTYSKEVPEEKKGNFIKDGDALKGTATPSLESLTTLAQPLIIKANAIADSAAPLVIKANEIAGQLDDMITKLNKDVLSGTSTQDLKDTISDLRSAVKNANQLLSQANKSDGTLGLLINDRQTAASLKTTLKNLQDLSSNLKAHGVLFYSDDTSKDNDKDKSSDKIGDKKRK